VAAIQQEKGEDNLMRFVKDRREKMVGQGVWKSGRGYMKESKESACDRTEMSGSEGVKQRGCRQGHH